jgi:predicted glycoside hydrolase/deacetylase ChbG (UPF0249 family)
MNRFLVVNADDFGQSPGVNEGIVEAHEHGIVTSASLMVRWPAATEAAAYAREHPSLSIGLHFDLGEWAYRDGAWVRLYEVVPADDPAAVAGEAAQQLAAFHRLLGRDPTHLDSHQHVHREEPARSVLREIARDLEIPLRHETPHVHYCGDFYGQTAKGEPLSSAIGVEALLRLLEGLPPGITELGCHPGCGDSVAGMYRAEREEEVRTLCDPRVRAALAALRMELRSFADGAGTRVG